MPFSIRRLVLRLANRLAPAEIFVALKYREQARKRVKGPFPVQNQVVKPRPDRGKVLVLSPHPDDEIIGPGGTLIAHLESGDTVTILYLTDGQSADSSLVQKRRQEAEEVGKEAGFEQIFWDLADTRLAASPETAEKLAALLIQLKPQIIYLTSCFERHYDHLAANQILAETLRRMKRPEYIIIGYEVWDNIPNPNYFVDISDTFEKKTSLMRRYTLPMEATDFVKLFRYRNHLNYLLNVNSTRQNREGYAEAFYRLDSADFITLFDTYFNLLASSNSPLAVPLSTPRK